MQPAKLDVLFAFFAYGGNGGIAMQLPEITSWFSKLCVSLHDDPRVGRFAHQKFGDIPLTMERNRAVVAARNGKFDVLVMVDSDNAPDLYLDADPNAKPFFDSSFDFLYERKLRGLPSVIVAPYCGPPPKPIGGGMENVYVFFPEDAETGHLESGYTFEGYSRQQAATMRGIQSIAAGPTGCIMYSVDAFNLMPVHAMTQDEILTQFKVGGISLSRAKRLLNMQSWFFYEFTDGEQTQKASTEDVTNTREIQLAGLAKHKEPVVFCNWDAWAGHYKPKCVGKPFPVTMGEVNALYQEAVERNAGVPIEEERLTEVDFTAGSPVEVKLQEDELQIADVLHNDLGKEQIEITPRMIGTRKVVSIGHITEDAHLGGLQKLVRVMAKLRGEAPLKIVEVGSWVGESAIAMHEALGPAGGVIYCVDTWEGSSTDMTSVFAKKLGQDGLFNYFKQNVGDLLDEGIRCIRGDSLDVAASFEYPQDADIVFLDASHDYESAKDDIEAWLPHVAPDGVICGHDHCEHFPGVERAVKEVCDHAMIIPKIIDGSTIWCFSKREWLEGIEKRGRKSERKHAHAASQD